jgi:hypothetical protein
MAHFVGRAVSGGRNYEVFGVTWRGEERECWGKRKNGREVHRARGKKAVSCDRERGNEET